MGTIDDYLKENGWYASTTSTESAEEEFQHSELESGNDQI